MSDLPQQFDPEMVKELRDHLLQELMTELESKDERERQKRIAEREKNKVVRSDYVTKMKESAEPWVEVIGIEPTEDGIRTELDWNDAFIAYLKSENVPGVDDEQVIQRYITSLLYNMVENMSDDEDSEYL